MAGNITELNYTDDYQICIKKTSDTVFYYAEVRELPDSYAYAYGEIDLSDYTEAEKEDYIKPYYPGGVAEVRESYRESANQIIAECIFEASYDLSFVKGFETEDEADDAMSKFALAELSRLKGNHKNAEEMREQFIKDGWDENISFIELTQQKANELGYTFAVEGIAKGRQYFVLKNTGDVYDSEGEIVFYNLSKDIIKEEQKMKFSMVATIKMSRDVVIGKDTIVPGSFTMKFPQGPATFDFNCCEFEVNSDFPNVITINCWDPDETYEDTKKITVEMLERVMEITDFFVFTGEKGETDLKPVKLLSLTFNVEGKGIGMPVSIIKSAVVSSNI